MGYQPKIKDHVRIRDYTGMLHPMTVWLVKETRPDLSLIVLPQRINGVWSHTDDRWVENEKLVKVYVPPSVVNDPDIASA